MYGAQSPSNFSQSPNYSPEPNQTYFNQQYSQLSKLPQLKKDQKPGISFIKICGTVLQPVTDFGVEVSVWNILTEQKIRSQFNHVFGNPQIVKTEKENDEEDIGVDTNDQFKLCQNLTLSLNDQLTQIDIQSYGDEITKLKFTTKHGQTLQIGHELRDRVYHRIELNTTDMHIVGFRGTLSKGSTGQVYFMSQLSFVIWKDNCLPKAVVIYGAAYVLLILILVLVILLCCKCKRKNKIRNGAAYAAEVPVLVSSAYIDDVETVRISGERTSRIEINRVNAQKNQLRSITSSDSKVI